VSKLSEYDYFMLRIISQLNLIQTVMNRTNAQTNKLSFNVSD